MTKEFNLISFHFEMSNQEITDTFCTHSHATKLREKVQD